MGPVTFTTGTTARRLLSLVSVAVLLLALAAQPARAQNGEPAGDDTGMGNLYGLIGDDDFDNDGDDDCGFGALRNCFNGQDDGDSGDGTQGGADDERTLGNGYGALGDGDSNNDGTQDEEEDTDGDGVANGKDKDPGDASDEGGEDHEDKEPGEGIEKAEGPDGETDAWGGITGVLTNAVRAAGVLGILVGCCIRAVSAQNTDGVALGNKIITAAVGGLALGLLAPGIYDLFFQWAPIGGGG